MNHLHFPQGLVDEIRRQNEEEDSDCDMEAGIDIDAIEAEVEEKTPEEAAKDYVAREMRQLLHNRIADEERKSAGGGWYTPRHNRALLHRAGLCNPMEKRKKLTAADFEKIKAQAAKQAEEEKKSAEREKKIQLHIKKEFKKVLAAFEEKDE